MEQFDFKLSSVIDSTLGMRCRLYGYQYSEIFRLLMSVYFCGGTCLEDMTFYIRANRCGSLYDDIFALRGWKKEELGGIEFELNSILVEKWKVDFLSCLDAFPTLAPYLFVFHLVT